MVLRQLQVEALGGVTGHVPFSAGVGGVWSPVKPASGLCGGLTRAARVDGQWFRPCNENLLAWLVGCHIQAPAERQSEMGLPALPLGPILNSP